MRGESTDQPIDLEEEPLFDLDALHEPDDEGERGFSLEGVKIPFELLEFGNGQLPLGELTKIGIGGHRLYRPAAEAWDRLRARARAAGIDLTCTDSYRSLDQQVSLKKRKPNLSATPGKSVHGWGFAVDVSIGSPPKPFGMSVLNWLKNNAPPLGWFLGRPEDEPWHWVYRGANDAPHSTPAPQPTRPATPAAPNPLLGPPPADRSELAFGSVGESVKWVQRRLGLTDDGEFGPRTEAGVRTFQGANGLNSDGRVGPRTWAKLLDGALPSS